MIMAKKLNVSRADAYTAVVDVWATLAADAEGDIVKGWTLVMLDAVVEMEMAGCGAVMLQAGLVGVVDDGLVLPIELRHHQRDDARQSSARPSHSPGADRQKRYRERKRLSVPAPKRALAAAAVPAPVNKPRRLGEVEGYPVMLLFSRAGVPFYKLAGALPREWTGTVTDQDNPSFADALAALHAAMKRESGKGFCSGDTLRPSLQAIVGAAERYRAALDATTAGDACRDEANAAFMEASAEDQDDIEHEPAERNASVTGDARNVTPVTGDAKRYGERYAPEQSTQGGAGTSDESARYVQRYASPPSSSSSSVFHGDEEKKNTTTTSSVTPHERDNEDGILNRFLEGTKPQEPATPAECKDKEQQRERWRQMAERFATGLKMTVAEVFHLWETDKPKLRTLLEAAGIDTATGFPVNASASHEPAAARQDIGVTTDPIDQDKPAAGSVDARDDYEPDESEDDVRERLLEQLRHASAEPVVTAL
jgi:hypothetical protein